MTLLKDSAANRVIGLDPSPAAWHPTAAEANRQYDTTGVLAVSLNRKRRIFRPNAGPLPWQGTILPAPRVFLAAVVGAATLGLAAWLFVLPHAAPAIGPANSRIIAQSGRLAVIDGDTLRVGDQVVRLEGIAAPARGSACGPVDCGTAAANALAALVRGGAVDCTIDGHDGLGRPVANCLASGVRLNEALVRDGWAHAETASLRATEAAARSAGRGIWRPGL